MPDNYPNAHFLPTQRARAAIAEQSLDLQEVIEVIQGAGSSWEGFKPNQKWHRSNSQSGRQLKVLVEDRGAGIVAIITVHDVQGGG